MQTTHNPSRRAWRAIVTFAFVALASCRTATPAQSITAAPQATDAPPAPPARWLPLIGEYGTDAGIRMVLERGGQLYLHTRDTLADVRLSEVSPDHFALGSGTNADVVFTRGADGRTTAMSIGPQQVQRRRIGPES